jgi:hypothetical protein
MLISIWVYIGGVGAFYETPQILETYIQSFILTFQEWLIFKKDIKKKNGAQSTIFLLKFVSFKSSIVCVGFSALKQNFQLREHLLQLD